MNGLCNRALAGVGASLALFAVGGCGAETANRPQTAPLSIEMEAALYVAEHGFMYPWGMDEEQMGTCPWSPEHPQPWKDAGHAQIVGSCALFADSGEQIEEAPINAYTTLAEAREGARAAFSLEVGQLVAIRCYTLVLHPDEAGSGQAPKPEVWVLVSTESGDAGVIPASAIGYGIPRDACTQGALDSAATGQTP